MVVVVGASVVVVVVVVVVVGSLVVVVVLLVVVVLVVVIPSTHSHTSQSKTSPSPQFIVGPYGHPQFATGHGQSVVVVLVLVVVVVDGGSQSPSHSHVSQFNLQSGLSSPQSEYLVAVSQHSIKLHGHGVVVVPGTHTHAAQSKY